MLIREKIEEAAERVLNANGTSMGVTPTGALAAAVLAAMREPTEAMICAGGDITGHRALIPVIWQAMIDAALAEPPYKRWDEEEAQPFGGAKHGLSRHGMLGGADANATVIELP